MNRMIGFAFLLLLGAVCITHQKGPDVETPSFQVGHTTLREVIALWGNPDSIKRNVAIWKTGISHGGKFKASYMLVGFTLASSNMSTCEHRLTFDEQGVLREYKVAESMPSGTPWTLWPGN